MKTKKLWSALGALALAGTGMILGTAPAQAAEIPDADGRQIGPFAYSSMSGTTPTASYWPMYQVVVTGAGAFNQLETGREYVGSNQLASWVTDADHPQWAQAAAGADLISIPALGTTGDVRFESGNAKGKCFSAVQGGGSPRAVRIEACSASTAKWSLEERAIGFVLVYRDTPTGPKYYYNQQYINTPDSYFPPGMPDLFNGSQFSPVTRTVADVTAHVVGEVEDGSVQVEGTGEPGATITVTGPDGTPYEAVVGEDGTWGPVTITGLEEGVHTLPVEQVVDGEPAGEISVIVTVPAAPADDVTAEVDGVDHADKSAQLSGTGEPGATVEVRDSEGDVLVETTVDENGEWSVTVPDLSAGENDLVVVQVVDGEAQSSVELTVTVQAGLSAQDVTVQMEQDSVVEIDVLAEASGDEVRLGEVVTDPEHGTVSIVDGTVVYTPGEGFTGEDSFQVTVVDTWGNSVVVTVTVIVAPFEDVPLVSAGVGLAGLALAGLGGAGYRVARTRRS